MQLSPAGASVNGERLSSLSRPYHACNPGCHKSWFEKEKTRGIKLCLTPATLATTFSDGGSSRRWFHISDQTLENIGLDPKAAYPIVRLESIRV